ncbi:GntR family transcriptional regulator [Sporolactobacillus shoreicorticis]|uniref:GntR family transcriptional regulator n=1 Tax=Sporolactobacillus shoreicorticis TaxID=1923877 RepID=A0ABW5S0Y3_9BACL|nr:GntR family transcriptional regulator [Sporolactobacillus shoreicorticis]MCO7125266.1 GntR family transcriptional regulator [Sporolactobacillus shoreicorticis]
MNKTQAICADIAQKLTEQIENGSVKSGDKLPSERELCAQFGVNHHVIRFALARLVHLGLVVSHQGKGVFVSERVHEISYPLTNRTRFTENLQKQDVHADGKLLGWQIRQPSQKECLTLQLNPKDQIYDLHIIRYASGQPVSLTQTILAEHHVPGLNTFLTDFHSLYQLLEDHYNIKPLRISSVLQAVISCRQDTEWLGIPENVPILAIESIANDPTAGKPFEISCSRLRGDMCRCLINF